MLHHLCVPGSCSVGRNPNAYFIVDSLVRDEKDLGNKAVERGILASLVSLIKSITPLDNTDEWEMDDAIYSVIAGSAINANGKGKSLTMPEGDMQTETIKEAYRVAGRDPAEAFYVELHATGTKVGDPIETNAAGKVFSKGRDANKTPCRQCQSQHWPRRRLQFPRESRQGLDDVAS